MKLGDSGKNYNGSMIPFTYLAARPRFHVAALALLLGACTNGSRPDAAGPTRATPDDPITLHTRSREVTDGGEVVVRERTATWKPSETAIIVTDMWDRHWCDGATRRVAGLAPRMNEAIEAARRAGVLVVHAPSDVISFYDGHPARENARRAPYAEPPQAILSWYELDPEVEAPLPIDDSDGGCDSCEGACEEHRAWSRQIETIRIADQDGISDDGEEIYSLLHSRGIRNVLLMGVHTNMCVLGRPFGIRAQRNLGMNVALVRDLTDTMYNPAMAPFVPHDEGTELVIQHIERYWAPTISSDDLLALDEG